jgi:hypothetical protein
MKMEIERAAAMLKGKALWRCLRAADMAMFDFGKRRKVYQQGDAIPEEFDWDVDQNRRDKLLASFLENVTLQLIVQAIEVSAAGALHIALENGFFLDLFPDDSLSGEHWRFFEPDKDGSHFVVTGNGIET